MLASAGFLFEIVWPVLSLSSVVGCTRVQIVRIPFRLQFFVDGIVNSPALVDKVSA